MRHIWEKHMKNGLITFLIKLRSWNTGEKVTKIFMRSYQNSFIYARLSKVAYSFKMLI